MLKSVSLNLLEHEVDIILKSLLNEADSINKKYNYRKKSLTEEESTEKFLIRNTYEHVFYCRNSQIAKSKSIKNKQKKKIA